MVETIDTINTLIEVVLEIRFKPCVKVEMSFQRLFNKISDLFEDIETLPIDSAPDVIKRQPNFQFAPYRRYVKCKEDQNYTVLQGPSMIAVSSAPCYCGWESFYCFASKVLIRAIEASIFNKIDRIGFKLVNFVPRDVFYGDLDFKVTINDSEIPYEETMIRTVLRNEFKSEVLSILQISNSATYNGAQGPKLGSVIDIDTIYSPKEGFDSLDKEILDNVHSVGKGIYRRIVTEQFIKSC